MTSAVDPLGTTSPAVPSAGGPALSTTQTGLLTGLVLGLAGAFGGFGAFLLVLVLGAVGLLVGRVLDGKLDLPALLGRASSRR